MVDLCLVRLFVLGCASVEIDHERGLPFNQRAHLMSAAILQDQSFFPWVGCCCNDDSF